MDRRTLLTMSLCLMIYFAWQKLYLEPRFPRQEVSGQTTGQVQQAPTQTQPSVQPGGATGQGTSGAQVAAAPKIVDIPPETKPLETSTGTAILGNGNKILTNWDLKSYRRDISPEAAGVDLKSVTLQDGEGEIAFDGNFGYLANVRGRLTQIPGGVVWNYEDDNVRLTREMTSKPDLPYVAVKLTAEFKKDRPNNLFLMLSTSRQSAGADDPDRTLVYWTRDDIETQATSDVDAVNPVGVPDPIKWVGTTSRYFLTSLVTEAGHQPAALIQPVRQDTVRIGLVYPVTSNSIVVPFKAYFGPKELDTLKKVEPTLDHTVDLGWFTWFAYPLLRLMKWIYSIVLNYGVAIIILTVIVKVLTFPLTYKSMKSMKEMQKVQPQLAKLKERYKDDPQEFNRQALTLMRTHGYNPMAGCLPILVQMPVFMALYQVLYSSIELYHAPFAFWLHDLSTKDPYYVTPVILTAVMYIQQKLTPMTATDPMQAKMIQFMPIMFGVFMLTLPSGLTLYMLVNALVSIIQQLILNKKLGYAPTVPARA